MIHYRRELLARRLVEALQGKVVFSDAHNGLFLTAPRRTGKSTFLQGDLKPAWERQGTPSASKPIIGHRKICSWTCLMDEELVA